MLRREPQEDKQMSGTRQMLNRIETPAHQTDAGDDENQINFDHGFQLDLDMN